MPLAEFATWEEEQEKKRKKQEEESILFDLVRQLQEAPDDPADDVYFETPEFKQELSNIQKAYVKPAEVRAEREFEAAWQPAPEPYVAPTPAPYVPAYQPAEQRAEQIFEETWIPPAVTPYVPSTRPAEATIGPELAAALRGEPILPKPEMTPYVPPPVLPRPEMRPYVPPGDIAETIQAFMPPPAPEPSIFDYVAAGRLAPYISARETAAYPLQPTPEQLMKQAEQLQSPLGYMMGWGEVPVEPGVRRAEVAFEEPYALETLREMYEPRPEPSAGRFGPPARTWADVGRELARRPVESVQRWLEEEYAAPFMGKPEPWSETAYWQGYPYSALTTPATVPPFGEGLTTGLDVAYNAFRKLLGSPWRAETISDLVEPGLEFWRRVPEAIKQRDIDILREPWRESMRQGALTVPWFSPLGVAGYGTALSRTNIELTNILPERLLWIGRKQNEKLREAAPNLWKIKDWMEQQARGQVSLPPVRSAKDLVAVGREIGDIINGRIQVTITPDEWLDNFDIGVIGYSMAVNPDPTRYDPAYIRGGVPSPLEYIKTYGSREAAVRQRILEGATAEQIRAEYQVLPTEIVLGSVLDLSWLPPIGKIQKPLYEAAYLGYAPLKAGLKVTVKGIEKLPIINRALNDTASSVVERSVRAKGDAWGEVLAQPGTPYEKIARLVMGDDTILQTVSRRSGEQVQDYVQQLTHSPLFTRVDEGAAAIGDVIERAWKSFGVKGVDVEGASTAQLRDVLERAWSAHEWKRIGTPRISNVLTKGLTVLKEAYLGWPSVTLRNTIDNMVKAGAMGYFSLPDIIDAPGRLARFMDGLDLSKMPKAVQRLGAKAREAVAEWPTTPRSQQILDQFGEYGMPISRYLTQGFVESELGRTARESQAARVAVPLYGKPGYVGSWWGPKIKKYLGVDIDLGATAREATRRWKQQGITPTDATSFEPTKIAKAWSTFWDNANIATFQEKTLSFSSRMEQLHKAGAALRQFEKSFAEFKPDYGQRLWQTLVDNGAPEEFADVAKSRFMSQVKSAADLKSLLDELKGLGLSGGRTRPSDWIDPLADTVQDSSIYQQFKRKIDQAYVDGTITADNLTKWRKATDLFTDKKTNEAIRAQAKLAQQLAEQAQEVEERAAGMTVVGAKTRINKALADNKIGSQEATKAGLALDAMAAGKKLSSQRQKALNATLKKVGLAPEGIVMMEGAEGIPVMITRKMRQELYRKGFSPAEIDKMTPEKAWRVMGGQAGYEPPYVYEGIISYAPADIERTVNKAVQDGIMTPEQAQAYQAKGQLTYEAMQLERHTDLKESYKAFPTTTEGRLRARESYYATRGRKWSGDWEGRFAKMGNDAFTGVELDPATAQAKVLKDDAVWELLKEEGTMQNALKRKRNATIRSFEGNTAELYEQYLDGTIRWDEFRLRNTLEWDETALSLNKIKFDIRNGLVDMTALDQPELSVPRDHPVRQDKRSLFTWTGEPIEQPAMPTPEPPAWTPEDLARKDAIERRLAELDWEVGAYQDAISIRGYFISPGVQQSDIMRLVNYADDGGFLSFKRVYDKVKKKYVEPHTGSGGVDELAAAAGLSVQDFLDKVEDFVNTRAVLSAALQTKMELTDELGILQKQYSPPTPMVPLSSEQAKAQLDGLFEEVQTARAASLAAGESVEALDELILDIQKQLEEMNDEPIIQLRIHQRELHDATKRLHDHAQSALEQDLPIIQANKVNAIALRAVDPLVGDWADELMSATVDATDGTARFLVDYSQRKVGETMAGWYAPFYIWPLRNIAAYLGLGQQVPQLITFAQRSRELGEIERKKQNLPPRFENTFPVKIGDTWWGFDVARTLISAIPFYTAMEEPREWPEEPREGWQGAVNTVTKALETVGLTPWFFNDIIMRVAGVRGKRPMSDVLPYTKYIRLLTDGQVDIERWLKEAVPGGTENIILDYYTMEQLDVMERKGELDPEAARIAKMLGMESEMYQTARALAMESADFQGAIANFLPFRAKRIGPEVKGIFDDQSRYYDMRDAAKRETDPDKKKQMMEKAGEFWKEHVEPHYETVLAMREPEELPKRQREDDFERFRQQLDDEYLPRIEALDKAEAPVRQVELLRSEYFERRNALYDQYEDVTETWKKSPQGELSMRYGDLRAEGEYEEAEKLRQRLAQPELAARGAERERLLWEEEPELMAVSEAEFLKYRSRNDTPYAAMRRVLRDKRYADAWDIVRDKSKSPAEKNEAKRQFNALTASDLLEEVLELHPEWREDVLVLTQLGSYDLPSFEELARIRDTPEEALLGEVINSFYSHPDGTARNSAEMRKVREYLRDQAGEGIYKALGYPMDEDWLKEHPENMKRTLIALGRYTELAREFPELELPEAAPTEIPEIRASAEASYIYAASNAVYAMEREKFPAELLDEYSQAMKFYAAGGKGKMPEKFVPISNFRKNVREKLGLEYDETAYDTVREKEGSYKLVKALPSWYTPDMSSADISAQLGLPSTQELAELSPALAEAMKAGRAEQAWWTKEPTKTTASGKKKSTSTTKKQSTRRSSYSSSRTTTYKKKTTSAKRAAPTAEPTNWEAFQKAGGKMIVEELVKSWMGKEEITPEGQEYLRAFHEKRGGGVPYDQWIGSLRAEWEGVKYTFREKELEQYGETLTWSELKTRASQYMIEELDSFFAGERTLSPEGWQYLESLAAQYAGDMSPSEWLAQLFRNWQRSMQYWGRDERIRTAETEMEPGFEQMMRAQVEIPTITHENSWTWISFEGKITSRTREILREMGAKESRKRKAWYIEKRISEAELLTRLYEQD